MAGIANGNKHSSSKGLLRSGSLRCTHIAVGTMRKSIRNITISAVINDFPIARVRSGCDGITFHDSSVLVLLPRPNGLVEKSNIAKRGTTK
jgi:hypothetical protein